MFSASQSAAATSINSTAGNSNVGGSPSRPIPGRSPGQVDPRGPRLAASVTTAVLALVLITGSAPLLLLQAVLFAAGLLLGPARSPLGIAYRRLVRPRLGPPEFWEDSAPLRFAQGVGLAFVLVGLLGAALGTSFLFLGAAAAALAAAFLNAAFGICLGCMVHLRLTLLLRRAKAPSAP